MARGRRVRICSAALALFVAFAMPGGVHAQGGARGAGPAATGRAAARKDLTGYWVSVVAEHWHLRMLVPPKGNFEMLPLNAEARRVANTWDPAKESEPCRSYGAAAIMRVPGRLHIHWADDNTLQVDIDSGTQTRLFHFGGQTPAAQGTGPAAQGAGRVLPPSPSASADRRSATREGGSDPPKAEWQGYSAAMWEGPARGGSAASEGAGDLKVMTTRMRPGYLRKNGVPYSENATLEEYFDRFREPNGDEWLVIDSIVRDPQYLTQPYLTSVAFKKIPDASGWDPTTCRADQPR